MMQQALFGLQLTQPETVVLEAPSHEVGFEWGSRIGLGVDVVLSVDGQRIRVAWVHLNLERPHRSSVFFCGVPVNRQALSRWVAAHVQEVL